MASVQLGNLLIRAARVIGGDAAAQTNAVVLAAKRADKAKFVAPTSEVARTAVLGSNSSVWFNAKVGAGSKLGDGACVMDGALVEEDCTIGEMCVIKPGAVVKRGTTLGPRVVVGVGAVIPEKSAIKESTVLADGWNGKTVTDSKFNATFAEEEVAHVLELASQHQTAWSRSLEERDRLIDQLEFKKANPAPSEAWENFLAMNPNPRRHNERRGLIFDK